MYSQTLGTSLRRRGFAAAAALALCWAGGAVGAPQTDAATEAVWAPKQLHFVYLGFTAKYSCDGLHDQMRRILVTLGARDDMQLRSFCSALTGPDPFPGVNIKVNVLQPADASAAGNSATVPAHWKTVDLVLDQDPIQASGDCELVEQVKQHVLPLFTTRNVEYSSACVPHQLQAGAIRLRADVLVADRNSPSAQR